MMRPTTIVAAAVLVLMAGALRLQARAGLPGDIVEKLEASVARDQRRFRIPGLSVAIAVRHDAVYAQGFGKSDLEHDVKVTTRTLFRTASIAKPMTATAVMQFVEAGRIDPDAPIQRYCSVFPEKPWRVTTGQLLGHLGGIRHYATAAEAAGTDHYPALEQALVLFKDDQLVHEPGTTYLYSTFGYSLLGCAIERVAGVTYQTYMQRHVFEPAGMDHTRVDDAYEVIPHRARGYRLITPPGEIYNAQLHDTSMKVPGGGLLSTPSDLVRFALALMKGRLVRPATVERMWTVGRTTDGRPTEYGLGWYVAPAERGLRRIWHTGGQSGASGMLLLIPEAGVVVALMTNLEGAPVGELAQGVLNVLQPFLQP
jgi:CubicO group peptidase (beta-lactamase class C family)